jgi:hypothetical protein
MSDGATSAPSVATISSHQSNSSPHVLSCRTSQPDPGENLEYTRGIRIHLTHTHWTPNELPTHTHWTPNELPTNFLHTHTLDTQQHTHSHTLDTQRIANEFR